MSLTIESTVICGTLKVDEFGAYYLKGPPPQVERNRCAEYEIKMNTN